MKSLNGYEEKTDAEICISYIKRFIVGLLIGLFCILGLFYILFAVTTDITLPFEVAATFNILFIIAGLILAVLFIII